MKTTVQTNRPATAATGVEVPAESIRLAVWVSLIAALAAVLVKSTTGISETAVVLTVIVVGFSLSWHATAQGSDPGT